jgi:hypothetical protein
MQYYMDIVKLLQQKNKQISNKLFSEEKQTLTFDFMEIYVVLVIFN